MQKKKNTFSPTPTLSLNYEILSQDLRMKEVHKICNRRALEFNQENPEEIPLSAYELEAMANYILYTKEEREREKEEKRKDRGGGEEEEGEVEVEEETSNSETSNPETPEPESPDPNSFSPPLSPNREKTIKKRETSLENLSEKNDLLYSIVREDKNQKLTKKKPIKKDDLEEIPFLQEVQDGIDFFKSILPRNYLLQRTIIEQQQSLYEIREAYKKTIFPLGVSGFFKNEIPWAEYVDFREVRHMRGLVMNYYGLKRIAARDFRGDLYWILLDFEEIMKEVREKREEYYWIWRWGNEGYGRVEVKEKLEREFGKSYSLEYISSIKGRKIPEEIVKIVRKKEEECEKRREVERKREEERDKKREEKRKAGKKERREEKDG